MQRTIRYNTLEDNGQRRQLKSLMFHAVSVSGVVKSIQYSPILNRFPSTYQRGAQTIKKHQDLCLQFLQSVSIIISQSQNIIITATSDRPRKTINNINQCGIWVFSYVSYITINSGIIVINLFNIIFIFIWLRFTFVVFYLLLNLFLLNRFIYLLIIIYQRSFFQLLIV